MNRTLIGVALVVLLLTLIGAVLIWYLALMPSRNGSVALENVSSQATVNVGLGVDVGAIDEAEAYFLLGFAHGREHPWTLNLLRQTALGRTGEWFGEGTLPIDRLTRTLGIASGARSAQNGLEQDDRRILASYARGVTQAFAGRSVLMDDHLVLFDVTPEAWQPWHSLAIERLIAWVSEPPTRPAFGDTAFAALEAFQQADESLRQWLRLHGFGHSVAWAADVAEGREVHAQFVYGASALPLLVPARLVWPGHGVDGVSIAGTPILIFSSGEGGTNLTLPSSTRLTQDRFAAGFPDSLVLRTRHERIVLESGLEQLVTIPFFRDAVFFSSRSFLQDAPRGRKWGSLQWRGTNGLTDWPRWRALTLESAGAGAGVDPVFELFDGHGLHVDSNGVTRVRGNPSVVERHASGAVFIAARPVGRHAARRFMQLVSDGRPQRAGSDVTSIWAEANVPVALSGLPGDSVFSPLTREAIDYLRNWDFRYDLASIGAVIFDAWMGSYSGRSNPFPTIVIPNDSLGRVETKSALGSSLVRAVDSLRDVAGSDLARWRLETFRRSERLFPVWSYPPVANTLPSVDSRRYAPMPVPQPGHPTTIAGESGLFDYPFNSPAHVVARARASGANRFSFRPDYHIGKGLIARHVVSAPEDGPRPFPASDVSSRITYRASR